MFEMPFADCFVPGCNFTYDCEKSNRTLEFQAAHTKVIECIGRFPKLEACTECSSLYNDLNKKYDEIRLKAENKFCFAIKFWVIFKFESLKMCAKGN